MNISETPKFPRCAFAFAPACLSLTSRASLQGVPARKRTGAVRYYIAPACSLAGREGGQNLSFFATCPRGLGDVLAREIEGPQVAGDVTDVHSSGVHFRGNSLLVGYAACLWLRTAIRVLHEIAHTRNYLKESDSGDDFDALYNFLRHAADWERLLPDASCTFSVIVRESPQDTRTRQRQYSRRDGRRASSSALDSHVFGTQRAQLCAKNAICDALRDAGLDVPERPANHADAYLPLLLSLHGGQVTLYRDMTGASLHKRGYRSNSALHRSSLNEAVASGMLYLAGFRVDGSFSSRQSSTGKKVTEFQERKRKLSAPSVASGSKRRMCVVDPMCGSGTLLIEAALMRLHVAPGLYRGNFPFQNWPDFDLSEWEGLVKVAVASQRDDSEIGMDLIGNDVEPAAVALAERDLKRTNLSHLVRITMGNAEELQLEKPATLVVSNPPWGRRLEGEEHAWEALGIFLRNCARGGSAMLLSGDPSLTRGLRMRAREKFPIRIGDVDCRAIGYDVLPARPEGHEKLQLAEK